jgi:hypothetical protein
MALTIWDAQLGASREATQEDIDRLQAKADAFGRLVHEIRAVEGSLFRTMSEIEERARMAKLSGDL